MTASLANVHWPIKREGIEYGRIASNNDNRC
jgi:hypothetical protein